MCVCVCVWGGCVCVHDTYIPTSSSAISQLLSKITKMIYRNFLIRRRINLYTVCSVNDSAFVNLCSAVTFIIAALFQKQEVGYSGDTR